MHERPTALLPLLALLLAGCGGGGGGSSGPTLPTAPLPGEMSSTTFRCETSTVAWGGGVAASPSYRSLVTLERQLDHPGFPATIVDR